MGKTRSLQKILGEDSLLLPGYFACEHLCHFTIKNLASKMARFRHHPKVVFLSVDANESWEDASVIKKQIKGPEGKYWSFVTADEATIKDLTKEIGFTWNKDHASGTITHESALFVMKNGSLGRKIPGYDLKEKDLDLSATAGKFFDFKQFCSAFDPSRSKYGAFVMRAISVSSLLFLALFGILFMRLRRHG